MCGLRAFLPVLSRGTRIVHVLAMGIEFAPFGAENLVGAARGQEHRLERPRRDAGVPAQLGGESWGALVGQGRVSGAFDARIGFAIGLAQVRCSLRAAAVGRRAISPDSVSGRRRLCRSRSPLSVGRARQQSGLRESASRSAAP